MYMRVNKTSNENIGITYLIIPEVSDLRDIFTNESVIGT